MIRTVAGIELETRPLARGDRAFVGVRLSRRTGYPACIADLLLDHGRCSVWCSAAHPTTLHGYVVFAHAELVDAFVVPTLHAPWLAQDAIDEMSGKQAA